MNKRQIGKMLRQLASYDHRRDGFVIEVPAKLDARKVREDSVLSQEAFARRYGLDLSKLRKWEDGTLRPGRAERILLRILAQEPDAAVRALAAWRTELEAPALVFARGGGKPCVLPFPQRKLRPAV